MAGRWFEEFAVGQVIEHEIRRTVTEFGQPLVNSIFTLGLVIGLSVQDTTLGTTVANLGMTDTRFPSPVLHGDTIRSRTTIKALRESKSRPNAGIVTFLHQGYNQRGEEVCTCERQALMLRKPS